MHEIQSNIPAPINKTGDRYAMYYWVRLFDKMKEGDHIVIAASEFTAVRMAAMRWRRRDEANLAYHFVSRRHPNNPDQRMVWKMKHQ